MKDWVCQVKQLSELVDEQRVRRLLVWLLCVLNRNKIGEDQSEVLGGAVGYFLTGSRRWGWFKSSLWLDLLTLMGSDLFLLLG